MVDTSVLEEADLTVSAARVAFAREFAGFQARMVDRAVGRIDDLNVDLLFLAQESILVFEETHRLVAAAAAGGNVSLLPPQLQLSEQLRALKAARRAKFMRWLIAKIFLATALVASVLLIAANWLLR